MTRTSLTSLGKGSQAASKHHQPTAYPHVPAYSDGALTQGYTARAQTRLILQKRKERERIKGEIETEREGEAGGRGETPRERRRVGNRRWAQTQRSVEGDEEEQIW